MNPRAPGLNTCLNDGYRLDACVLILKTLFCVALSVIVNGLRADNSSNSSFRLRGKTLFV
jgi:hypothetical protein